MIVCLLTPLQNVAGEFMMAARPCDPSSLFLHLCLSPPAVVSRLFRTCPHTTRALFPPSSRSSSPPLSVSISPISYTFRYLSVSSAWCYPPLLEKLPISSLLPFEEGNQILLPLLELILHPLCSSKSHFTHLQHLSPLCWKDNLFWVGVFFPYKGSWLLGATAISHKY